MFLSFSKSILLQYRMLRISYQGSQINYDNSLLFPVNVKKYQKPKSYCIYVYAFLVITNSRTCFTALHFLVWLLMTFAMNMIISYCILFQTPLRVHKGETITATFWRCVNSRRIWYEWIVEVGNYTTPLHNPNGRSSEMLLWCWHLLFNIINKIFFLITFVYSFNQQCFS